MDYSTQVADFPSAEQFKEIVSVSPFQQYVIFLDFSNPWMLIYHVSKQH